MHFLIGGVMGLFGVVSLAVAAEALYRGRIQDHRHLREGRSFRRSREPLQFWVRTTLFAVLGCLATGFAVWLILARPALTTQGGTLRSRKSPWEWTGHDWLVFLVVLLVVVVSSCLWQWLLRRERRSRARRRKARKAAAAPLEEPRGKSETGPHSSGPQR